MRIRFIGTAAADFSPLLKTQYRDRLGKDQRRSSSLLVEGRYLVDCGPHVLESLRIQNIDCSGITDLLLTHLHSDHYDRGNVEALAAMTAQPLRIWYRAGGDIPPVEHGVLCPMAPGERGSADELQILALASNHTAFPLHYDLELEGKRLFYGCDGAWLLYDTYYAMRDRAYDCMILDATVGDYTGDYRMGEHNSIPMLRLMAASFPQFRITREDTLLVLSHIAPSLHRPHDETVELVKKDGFTVAYDGMELKF